MSEEVRVRFAPSPTGALHIGGAHTALFNWLWARHMNGKFILRIEDTDRVRSTAEYEQTIMDGMRWLDLDWDEGPDVGGDYGPYRQTERLDLYNKYAQQLLDEGKAYREGTAIIYKVPTGLDIGFDDEVYGHIDFKSDALIDGRTGKMKDIVMIKSDGFPAYNYAVVVDDHLMKISHVIRGEDHISNTPKQVLLYKALGWELPKFAHLPMILGKDKKKLSKRHGATSVYEYRDMGYLPESIFNFLALLGWAPKGDTEIFGRDLAIKEYELHDINRKSSVFDFDKLDFLNQAHITDMPVEKKYPLVRPFWEEMGIDCSDLSMDYLKKAFELMAGRGKTIKELAEFSDYLVSFDRVAARYDVNVLSEEQQQLVRDFDGEFVRFEHWDDPKAMLEFARAWCDEHDTKLKKIAMPLRFILTGYKVSPGLFEVIEVLGREECMKRMKHYGLL